MSVNNEITMFDRTWNPTTPNAMLFERFDYFKFENFYLLPINLQKKIFQLLHVFKFYQIRMPKPLKHIIFVHLFEDWGKNI
jgi:hypothetical protein